MEGLGQIPTQGAQQPNAEEEAAKRAQEEEMRRDVMATVLDPAARERRASVSRDPKPQLTLILGGAVARIALVSPERSKQIEGILMRLVQSGQLRGRVTEGQLIDLLEQMEDAGSKNTAKKSTVIFQRRPDPDDDFDF
ncbi:Programmed cell death protein 5 [Mycena kentingensis (nom. inval.)]|nr:Programmed cell death protein 5 [Mycena kentingensis (nom. inval.)]